MNKTRSKRFYITGWTLCAIFAILGLFLVLTNGSYTFSGLILLGIALVIACYLLLIMLGKNNLKLSKVLIIVFSFILGIGIIAAAITGCVIWSASKGQAHIDCQYIIVLGAGVDGTVPSLTLRERISAAYNYLVAHPKTIAIVSGGQGYGEDITEALCMYQELTAMGIDESRIWMEDKATNTKENLQFSLDLVEEQTGTRPAQIGLVSSEYHLFRADLFAKRQNVTAYGIPAETSWASLRINFFLREIAAVWYYIILGG